MHAIQVDHVVKRYKNGVQALNGLSLSVKEGEIFSLLGQNGAGKSTLIRILTTYLCPTAGEIEMMGKDIKKDAAVIRSQIACVAQQTSIDTYLSLEENMMFQSRLYKIPKAEATALFPANEIDGVLGTIINLNPFTHVINALRSLILYGYIECGELFFVIILFTFMAGSSFVWALHRLKKETAL